MPSDPLNTDQPASQARQPASARPVGGRRLGTRERIVQAAGALLYHEGVRAAGVDAIAERAGVAKRTLYKHFRSKDDLIEAYLRKLDESSRRTFEFLLGEPGRPAEQRVANLFRELGGLVVNVRWKGCGFAKAAIELAGLPGHPAAKVARDHKRTFELWLAELLKADGVPGPEKLARRLMVLVDGAITQGVIHHEPAVALEAREMAVELIAAARRNTDRHPAGGAELARAC
jgi:AcrR family transcriptional regulator